MSLSGAFWCGNCREEVEQNLRLLAHRDPADSQVLAAGEAALGRVNPESSLFFGAQVLVAASGSLLNADELWQALQPGHGGAVPSNVSIAQITALAFERWGESFPDRLDGAFAFALWDASRRRLLLGRDAMGQEPLHYAVAGDTLLCASEPRGLIGWRGCGTAVDEDTLAHNMVLQPDRTRTLFRGIRAVPGGHVLVADSPQLLRLVQYWQPLRQGTLRVRDSREYADGLREAMERAVAVRLPQTGSVASMLSAGFDSSSVTALAARQLAAQGRSLHAYTSAPSHRNASAVPPGRFADEWPLAAQVAAMYPNITHVRVGSAQGDWMAAMDRSTDAWGGPPAFLRNFRWFHSILEQARESGVTTLFEGSTGNMTGSYDGSLGLFDLLRQRDLPGFLRAVWLRRRHGLGWKGVVNQALMPRPRATAAVRRLLGSGYPARLKDVSLLRPEVLLAAGMNPEGASVMGAVAEGDRTSGRHWRFHILQRVDMGMTNAAYMRLYGIRRADPTADRRLVEFCLSIPDHAFFPGGRPRELYRKAMQQVLPHDLLHQKGRGLQASDFVEAFQECLPQFRQEVERLRASEFATRVLDVDRMAGMLECWTQEIVADPVRADTVYNFTFGGALTAGRFLRRWQQGTFGSTCG